MPIKGSDNMERNVFRDYLGAKIVSNNVILDYYSKIYYQANENLIDIYLDMDFEDKDVLSVVSSSDQIYTPKLLGARRVDGFDRNRLTKYYYYLRRWAIIYNDDLYPYPLINGDRNYLAKLLNKVVVWSDKEKDAYEFWKSIYIQGVYIDNLFYDDRVNVGKTLFEDNVKYLYDTCVEDLNYANCDLFSEVNGKRTYDYIMISNILEYCRGDKEKIKTVRDNLFKLLNKDGTVICSHLIRKPIGMDDKELEVFDEKFEFDDYGMNKGYVYKKRG